MPTGALWPRNWGLDADRYGDLDTDYWLLDEDYVPIMDQAGNVLITAI